MAYRVEKLGELEKEYSALLRLLPGGELAIRILEMQGTPIDQIDERIVFLETKIAQLKKELIVQDIYFDDLA